jgi:Fe-S oxidoreductase/FAD/FMN-containing dehydrogenase
MGMNATTQRQLQEMFGERVTFDRMERKIYSHDVGVMPKLLQPLIGKTLADAVVQPKSEDELIALVKWADENHVPLIPRGKATSGYGGVVPAKGGITVDMRRFRRILHIDPVGLTATVRPSVVWKELEYVLAKQDLALRLYPSSAPSSTVAGWLAQGGVGYGSYEYGPFRENVVSARVLLPTGEMRVFEGKELDVISDAEGITGIILEIALRLRRAAEESIWGVRFSSAKDLVAAIRELAEKRVPLWSISFINPKMAELKGQIPPALEHGEPVGEPRPEVPVAYVAIFVGPAEQKGQIASALLPALKNHGGTLLPADIAEHEWGERFNILHVKRLGPSLVPAEVVLPLEGLAGGLEDIERLIRQPFVLEGMVSKSPLGGYESTLLGFIPHDERRLTYNLAFGLALSVLNIAKKHGGRAYSTGLYFKRETESVLGVERVAQLRAFKTSVDPLGIMNPGKVLGNGALSGFMGLAETFEPLVRAVANPAKAPVGERIQGQGKRGIPDDTAWYAYACAQCGYCVDECDQYYGRIWESQSPRGKWFFLREFMEGRAKMTQEWVDTFMACTTCELCNVKCPLELPIEPSWLGMRGDLIHKQNRLTFPPFEIMRASLRKELNIWAGYRQDRPRWMPDDKVGMLPERAEIGYFPGCTASYVEHDIAQATACLMNKAGVEFTYLGKDEACCGIPMLVSGLWDTWEEILRHNVDAMKARGVKTVVTSCPACWLVWKTYYPEWAAKLGIDYPFETKHWSEVIAEQIAAGKMQFDQQVDMKVTWHDSCHMGRAGAIYEAPRQVLQAIPGIDFVEMRHNRQEAHCCGSVLSLVADPEAAKRIGDMRLQEAEDTGAEALIASCPCCEVQLRVTADKTGRDIPIIDLAHLACKGAGIAHLDPTPYAIEMWGVFEAMINLLKPDKMALLFEELYPQMFAAMPGPMLGMMKVAKRVPGMLSLMKPIMPKMMPILVPMLMPKVMPDMLAAVERRVPMPETMKEQMPDLLPAAMENLMPKMLPMIAPLVTPSMIEYIREKL